jgi:tetratricopeptide (TPR) repeat protein
MPPRLQALTGLLLLSGCAAMSEPPTQVTPPAAEIYSLFGEPLAPPRLPAATRESLEAELHVASVKSESNPDDVEATLRLARRMAQLGRFRAAVAVLSERIASHPDDARLYRDRGHRYLELRRFESAVSDLAQAGRLVAGEPDIREPEALPVSADDPTQTLHSGICYDLGLARFLTGDFTGARQSCERCLELASEPDPQCAARFWLWQSLERSGLRDTARAILAPIRAEAAVTKGRDYLRLLLLYRGEVRADTLLATARRAGGAHFANVAYGIASWRWSRGEKAEALALLRAVVKGEDWASPAHLAAEADLFRLGERP